jgi:hypothetical protein
MAIRIDEVKSTSLSDDKKHALVVGYGKYVGSVELRFATECLDDLIDALVGLKGGDNPAPANASLAANPSSIPSPDRDETAAAANPDEIRFEVPKNFTVTIDANRGLVLLIVDRLLEKQHGYALSPDAASQLAGGLTKSADALLVQKPQVSPLN